MNLIRSLFRNRKSAFGHAKIIRTSSFNNINELKVRLNNIDSEIKLITQEIFKAQIVRLRSFFNGESNIIMKVKSKIVESNASKSAKWHQKELLLLYQEKKKLQIQLDYLTGKIWPRRINSFIRNILLFIIVIFSFIITVIFTAVYLLPIFILIIIGLIITKSSNSKL